MTDKTENISSDVKDRLMKEALALFTNKGYAAASVREIVEAAGVTKPVLYYYFKNKEDIYLEMVRDVMSHYEDLLKKIRTSDMSYAGRVICFLSDLYEMSIEHLDYVRLFHSVFLGPPQGAPNFDFENFHEAVIGELLSIVKEGVRKGEFKKGNEEDMAMILMGVTTFVIDDHLAHTVSPLKVKDLKRMLNIVISTMEKQTGKGKS